jgi:hypothetical protein
MCHDRVCKVKEIKGVVAVRVKFARQGCAIRKHACIQVMLVADVRPGDLAYAGATDASE